MLFRLIIVWLTAVAVAEDPTLDTCTNDETWVPDGGNIRYRCSVDGATRSIEPINCIASDNTELPPGGTWRDSNFIWSCNATDDTLSYTIGACLTPNGGRIDIGEKVDNWVCEKNGNEVTKYYQEDTQCTYNDVKYDVGEKFPKEDGTVTLQCHSSLEARAYACLASDGQTIKVGASGTVEDRTVKCVRDMADETVATLEHAGNLCIESDGKTTHGLNELWEANGMLYKCQLDGLNPTIRLKKCMHVVSEAETVAIRLNSISKDNSGQYYWCKRVSTDTYEVATVSREKAMCNTTTAAYNYNGVWSESNIRYKCKWSAARGHCYAAATGCTNDDDISMGNEDIMANLTGNGANKCLKVGRQWTFSALSAEEYAVWLSMQSGSVSGSGSSGSGSQQTELFGSSEDDSATDIDWYSGSGDDFSGSGDGSGEIPEGSGDEMEDDSSHSDSEHSSDDDSSEDDTVDAEEYGQIGSMESDGSCNTGSSKIDLVLVIDNSGSVGTENYSKMKTFISSFVDSFDIGADKVQIATVRYSGKRESGYIYIRRGGILSRSTSTMGTQASNESGIHIVHHLDKFSRKEDIKNAISTMPYSAGKTATGEALKVVREQVLTAKGSRAEAARIVVVFTDGQSNDGIEPEVPAKQLADNGTIVHAVGISSGIDFGELLEISQSEKRVHQIDDFSSLTDAVNNQISTMVCLGETTQDTMREMEEDEKQKLTPVGVSAWTKLKQSLVSSLNRVTAKVPSWTNIGWGRSGQQNATHNASGHARRGLLQRFRQLGRQIRNRNRQGNSSNGQAGNIRNLGIGRRGMGIGTRRRIPTNSDSDSSVRQGYSSARRGDSQSDSSARRGDSQSDSSGRRGDSQSDSNGRRGGDSQSDSNGRQGADSQSDSSARRGDSQSDSNGRQDGDNQGDSNGRQGGDSQGDSNGRRGGDSQGDSNGRRGGGSQSDSNGRRGGDNQSDSNARQGGDSQSDSNGRQGDDSQSDSNGRQGGDSQSDSNGRRSGDSQSDSSVRGGDSQRDSNGRQGGDSQSDSNGRRGGDSQGDSNGRRGGGSQSDSNGRRGSDSQSDSNARRGGDSQSDSNGRQGGDSQSDSNGQRSGDSQSDSSVRGGDSQHDSNGRRGGDSQSDSNGRRGGDSQGDSNGRRGGGSQSDSNGRQGGDSQSDSNGRRGGDSQSDSNGRRGGDSQSDSNGRRGGGSQSDSNGRQGGDSQSDSNGQRSGDSQSDSSVRGGDSQRDSNGRRGGDSQSDSNGRRGGDSQGDSNGRRGGDSQSDSSVRGGDSQRDSNGRRGGDSQSDSNGRRGGDSQGDSNGRRGGGSQSDSNGRQGGDSQSDSNGRRGGDSQSDSNGRRGGDSQSDSNGRRGGGSQSDSNARQGGDSQSDSNGRRGGDSQSDSNGRRGGGSQSDSNGRRGGDSQSDSNGRQGGDSQSDSSARGGDSQSDSSARGDSQSDSSARAGDSQSVETNGIFTLTSAGVTPVSFHEAERLCRQNDPPGQLPSFRDRKEYEQFCNFRAGSSVNYGKVWTGLKFGNIARDTQDWTFTDGTLVKWSIFGIFRAPGEPRGTAGRCAIINGNGKVATRTCGDSSHKAAVICTIDSQDLRVEQELKLPAATTAAPEPDEVAPQVAMPIIGAFSGTKCRLNHTFLDLVVVVDDSGSIGRSNFDKIVHFLANFVQSFEVKGGSTRIAIVKYSGKISYGIDTVVQLNSFTSSSVGITTAILNMKYNGGRTATGEALYHVESEILTEANGMRKDSKKVVMVVTDGRTNDGRRPKNIAARLVKNGVFVFAIGITKGIREKQLVQIAQSKDRVVHVSSFKNLNLGLTDDVVTMICGKGPASQGAREFIENMLPGQTPPTTASPIAVATPSVAPLGTFVPQEGKCVNSALKLDLVLLIDESGSVGLDNFEKLKTFLADFVDGFDIGSDKVRIATVKYSGVLYKGPNTVHNLNTFSSAAEIKTAIANMEYKRGKTATGHALKYVKSDSLAAANGHRTDAKTTVIVFTDGSNNDGEAPSNPASELIRDNIIVYAVGISQGIKFSELKEIAKRDDRIFQVDNFDLLDSVVKKEITQLVCGAAAEGNSEQRSQAEQQLPVQTAIPPTVTTVTQPPPTLGVYVANKCRTSTRQLDLVLLVDESGSVGSENYIKMKKFCSDFVDSFDIDSGLVQVATVRYSGKRYWGIHTEHDLNQLSTKQAVKDTILAMPYRKGATATGEALKHIKENVLTSAKGMRRSSQKIVIVLTDGRTNDGEMPYNPAAELIQRKVLVFAIGISRGISSSQLMDITHDNSRIFHINNFDELGTGIRDSITSLVCGEGPASQTERLQIEQQMPTVTTPIPRPAVVFSTAPAPTLGSFEEKEGKCSNSDLKLDLVFVVDESGSVGRINFKSLRKFLASLVGAFEIGKDKVQVATVKYSGSKYWGTHKVHDFNHHSTLAGIQTAIRAMKYKGGRTATGEALDFVRTYVMTAAAGMRTDSYKVVIVFTDGKNNDGIAPSQPAAELVASGNIVYAVGITKGIRKNELLSIAKVKDRVYQVNKFSDLGTSIKNALVAMVCDGHNVTVPTPQPTQSPVAPVIGNFQNGTCQMRKELLDLALVIDESGSVGERNYKEVKSFVQSLVDSFSIDDGTVRVATVRYSGEKYYGIHIEHYLSTFSKKTDVKKKIGDMPYKGGATATGAALKTVKGRIFSANNGMRANAHKIAVVITDGKTNDGIMPKGPASDLRKAGITVYAVGITKGINDAELVDIAGDNHRIFQVDNFQSLGQDLRDAIAGAVCGTESADEQRTSNELTLPKVPVTVLTWRGGSVDKEAPNLGDYQNGKCSLNSGELDLVLLIDESGSVGRNNFEKVKDFASNLIDTFDGIDTGRVRVALVKYSGSRYYGVECVHHLRETESATKTKNAITGMQYMGGATATGVALQFVKNSVLTAKNGKRQNAHQIVLVITDGRTNDGVDPAFPAKQLAKANVMVYAIGITRGIRHKQLYDISQSYDRILHVHKFDALGDKIKDDTGVMICGNGTRGMPPGGWGLHGGRCFHPGKAEIVFAVPDTKSAGYNNYNKLKDYVVNMTNYFDTDTGKVRAGFVQFSGVVDKGIDVQAWLHHNLRGDTLRQTILGSQYKGGGKHAVGEAMARIHQNMLADLEESRGRPRRIMIVFTDAEDDDGLGHSVSGASKKMRKDRKGHIQVYGVGITNSANFYELRKGTRTSRSIYMVEKWSQVDDKLQFCMMRSVCDYLNGVRRAKDFKECLAYHFPLKKSRDAKQKMMEEEKAKKSGAGIVMAGVGLLFAAAVLTVKF